MRSFMTMRGRRSVQGAVVKIALGVAPFLGFAAIPTDSIAQNAAQAWLKYRTVGKPLGVPTRVDVLGQGLVEQTAAIELRRGLLSLSGGASLENGPNMILLGNAQEMRSRESKG